MTKLIKKEKTFLVRNPQDKFVNNSKITLYFEYYDKNFYGFLGTLPEHLAFGKVRRNKIKNFFEKNPDSQILVNTTRTIQIKNDPDIKKLLKNNFLKVEKEKSGSKSKRTFLILNK